MKEKIKTKKKQKNWKKILIPIVSVVIVLLILASVYAAYLLPYKNVFLEVGKEKLTYDELNYQIYLAAKTLNAPMVNLQSSDPKDLVAARNVLQLAYINAISDSLLASKAREQNIKVTQDEINTYVDDLKERVGKDFNDKDLALTDFLNNIGVNKNSFNAIVEKLLLAEKEKSELTKDIKVSYDEVKSFYNDFWTAYTKDEKEKDAYFKENYAKIEATVLENKKNNYVNQTLRQRIIRDNIKDIKVDNPYKQFMRFWYGTFLGTDIPERYKNTSIQDLLS